MNRDDCYQLGEVIKTHGLRGEVSVSLDVDYPHEYENLESVFLEQNEKLIPFFIESIQIQGNKAIVQFEDVNSLEEAQSIVNAPMFLPLSRLPKLGEGQYYFHDLVGCIVSEDGVDLGKVDQVIDLSGNQLIVMVSDGKEVLIPLKDEIITHVDIDRKKVSVQLPEGLMDIYNE